MLFCFVILNSAFLQQIPSILLSVELYKLARSGCEDVVEAGGVEHGDVRAHSLFGEFVIKIAIGDVEIGAKHLGKQLGETVGTVDTIYLLRGL